MAPMWVLMCVLAIPASGKSVARKQNFTVSVDPDGEVLPVDGVEENVEEYEEDANHVGDDEMAAPPASPAPCTTAGSDLFDCIGEDEQKSMFVIDVSCSMAKGCHGRDQCENKKAINFRKPKDVTMCPILSMLDELKVKLGALSPPHRFSIIAFAGETQQLSGGWLKATPDNKLKAVTWINNLRANKGSRMDTALKQAADQSTKPDVIHIISDGLPTGDGCKNWNCFKDFLCEKGKCQKVYTTLLNPNGKNNDKYHQAKDLLKLIALDTGDATHFREPFPAQ